MTPTRMQTRLRELSDRFVACGGSPAFDGGLSLILSGDRWVVTSSGGRIALRAFGSSPDEAFRKAEAVLANMEAQREMMAKTIGIEAI